MTYRISPEKRERHEANTLANLLHRVDKAERIYFHHPKYGRFKNYDTSISYKIAKDDPNRLAMFNWINANAVGQWSIDDIVDEGSRAVFKTYQLSFSLASDALIFKLTWGNVYQGN